MNTVVEESFYLRIHTDPVGTQPKHQGLATGKTQTLVVKTAHKDGYVLADRQGNEVFMPTSKAPGELEVGAEIDVFPFIDGSGKEIATSQLPLAEAGEFACLKVAQVTSFGTFLNIGLPKDLLVPANLKRFEMAVGEIHLVRVLIDDNTGQLYGTQKFGEYIESQNIILSPMQAVKIIPFYRTPLGFKVLIDKKYTGMIYHNEIFSQVSMGTEYEGTVKTVKDCGQVDVLFGKTGLGSIQDSASALLDAIKNQGGRLELGDKSDPESIKKTLKMSKKAFKRASGQLYRQQRVRLGDTFIELIPT